MKNLIILLFLVAGLSFTSCKKEPCVKDNACKEYPAKNEPCDAAFQRWFYDAKSGDCYLKGYSGCEAYGFASKEECEKCDCEKDSYKSKTNEEKFDK